MLPLEGNKRNETRNVSIRYDQASRVYYVFYYRTDISIPTLILSYDLTNRQWTYETKELKHVLERQLNCLCHQTEMILEEQARYLIHHLDVYFMKQAMITKNTSENSRHIFRRLRGIRRWSSENTLKEWPSTKSRYLTSKKSSTMNVNNKKEEIISVKALADSFYTDDSYRNRARTYASLFEPAKKQDHAKILDKTPIILELWLDVTRKQSIDSTGKLGCSTEEIKLKELAERFVTYFCGTFQCDIGHQYQLQYDGQTWYFTVNKVQFLARKISDTTKVPKTKIVFLVDGIPHYVRG